MSDVDLKADDVGAKPVAGEEVLKRLEALEKTNERLLAENVGHKKARTEAEKKLDELEKKKLEETGNIEKLYAMEVERTKKLEEKNKGLVTKTLQEKLRAEASKYAKDAHDIDMVLKVTEHAKFISMDTEELNVSGVKDYVEAVRATHPFMFSKSGLPTTENKKPSVPGGPITEHDPNADYKAALKACKTQQEFDAVRLKFGRV